MARAGITRKFNGKIYKQSRMWLYGSKRSAIAEAKKLRAEGYSVRVTPTGGYKPSGYSGATANWVVWIKKG